MCFSILLSFSSIFHSVRSVMYKYLEKENEISFDKIFNQILGNFWFHFYFSTNLKVNSAYYKMHSFSSQEKNILFSLEFIRLQILFIYSVKYLKYAFSVFFSTLFLLLLLLYLGYLLFKDFCENASEEPVPHLKFYEEVSFTLLVDYIFLSWYITLSLSPSVHTQAQTNQVTTITLESVCACLDGKYTNK